VTDVLSSGAKVGKVVSLISAAPANGQGRLNGATGFDLIGR
jgi:hypothetical protein